MTRKKTIFVSIAAYRDRLCSKTIRDLYQKAQYPERIFVGICQQNKEDGESETQDEHCLHQLMDREDIPLSNIRMIRVPHFQAKGPTYARYFCSLLWEDEDYFFQIDSHSLFVKHWDTIVLDMMHTLEHDHHIQKPILSHYCDTYERYEEHNRQQQEGGNGGNFAVTTITQAGYDNYDMIYFLGAEYVPVLSHPRLSPFVSAQMFFVGSQFLTDVPFDPFLPDLFFGEEILLSVRAFTHGYHVFTPNQNIIFHSYIRDGSPKYWNDLSIDLHDSLEKVKYLIGLTTTYPSSLPAVLKTSLTTHGVGDYRSVDDYWKWLDIHDIQSHYKNKITIRVPDRILHQSFSPTLPFVPPSPSSSIKKYVFSHHWILWGLFLFLFIVMALVMAFRKR